MISYLNSYNRLIKLSKNNISYLTKSYNQNCRQQCTCTERRVKCRVHREPVGDNTAHESRISIVKVTNFIILPS